jgi:hypothetical protein
MPCRAECCGWAVLRVMLPAKHGLPVSNLPLAMSGKMCYIWRESGDKQRFSALLVHSRLFGRLDRVSQVGCNDLRCWGKSTGYPERSQDGLVLYESVGRKFESCRAHHKNKGISGSLPGVPFSFLCILPIYPDYPQHSVQPPKFITERFG